MNIPGLTLVAQVHCQLAPYIPGLTLVAQVHCQLAPYIPGLTIVAQVHCQLAPLSHSLSDPCCSSASQMKSYAGSIFQLVWVATGSHKVPADNSKNVNSDNEPHNANTNPCETTSESASPPEAM